MEVDSRMAWICQEVGSCKWIVILSLRYRRQVMFSTKIKNRGRGRILGKDVWFIKEHIKSDVSMWEPCKDFQLTGGNADRTQKRSELKALHWPCNASLRLPGCQGGGDIACYGFLRQSPGEWLITKKLKRNGQG